MSKYNEELQKEAEKLARMKWKNDPKAWGVTYDMKIQEMLPYARYVLEARAESAGHGWVNGALAEPGATANDFLASEGYLPTEKEVGENG